MEEPLKTAATDPAPATEAAATSRSAGHHVLRVGKGGLTLMRAFFSAIGICVLALAGWVYWDDQMRAELALLLQDVVSVQLMTPEQRVLKDFRPIVRFSGGEALTTPQALVARHIARRFRIGRQPAEEIVRQAVKAAAELKLDPYLILAVAAVESRFNPFAESGFGAQGLMQILPRFHRETFLESAGEINPYDPAGSIRVGAVILSQYQRWNGGSLERALVQYLGAIDSDSSNYLATVHRLWADFSRVAGQPIPAPLLNPTQAPALASSDALSVPDGDAEEAALPPASVALPASASVHTGSAPATQSTK